LIKTSLNYRNWPIFYKMAIVFSGMATIIVLSVGFVFYQIYRTSMERQIGEFVPQSLVQVNRQIEGYVNDLKLASQMSLAPPYNQVTSEVLVKLRGSTGAPSLAITLKLQEMIDLLKLRVKERLYGVTFYAMSGDSYVYEQYGGVWTKDRPYQSQDWFSRLDLDNYSPLVLGTIRQPDSTSSSSDNENVGFVFSIVQPMRLPGTKELAGILQIFGSLDALSTVMQGIDFGPGSRLFIVDQDDKVVYTSVAAPLGEKWNSSQGIDWSRQRTGAASKVVQLDGKSYLASYNWSVETGWKVVGITPMENFSKGISTVRVWTGIGVVLGILVAISLSSLLAYGFAGRLRKLSRQVRSVYLDDKQLELGNVQLDEISYLTDSFDYMINHIRHLIEEVLKVKILQQEAEIKALHSQINPHFLFNVLEAIRMTIKKGNIAEAESAMVSLGQVFRYQLMHKSDHTSVGIELEFVEQYLQIQRLRYGYQLHVELDIAPETLGIRVPRMIIQPLIENALKHGQSPADHHIQLIVRIYTAEERLALEIIDEGNGMSAARLNEVLEGLEKGHTSDNRIGLANVYQRVMHMYGSNGQMSIQSEIGAGTIVRIVLPALLADHSEAQTKRSSEP
jgi:two-component system sensor histidine kinase YesM